MLDIEALHAINRDVMRGHTQLSIILIKKKKYYDMVNVSTIFFIIIIIFYCCQKSLLVYWFSFVEIKNMLTQIFTPQKEHKEKQIETFYDCCCLNISTHI